MIISNGINNSSGKLTQFGISANNNSNLVSGESSGGGGVSGMQLDNGSDTSNQSEPPNGENESNMEKKELDSDIKESEGSEKGSLLLSSVGNQDSQDMMDEPSEAAAAAAVTADANSETPYPSSGSPPPELDSSGNNSKSSPPLPTHEQVKALEAVNDATLVKLKIYNQLKSLPWMPKVRLCELETFLDQERKKFLGYGDLSNDLDTLVGLPNPIHESIKILKQHLYISLADEQIKLEERMAKYPMSTPDVVNFKLESQQKQRFSDDLPNGHNNNNNNNGSKNADEDMECPAEILFSNLLNNLPQYLVI
jgi:hypothetical protein